MRLVLNKRNPRDLLTRLCQARREQRECTNQQTALLGFSLGFLASRPLSYTFLLFASLWVYSSIVKAAVVVRGTEYVNTQHIATNAANKHSSGLF